MEFETIDMVLLSVVLLAIFVVTGLTYLYKKYAQDTITKECDLNEWE